MNDMTEKSRKILIIALAVLMTLSVVLPAEIAFAGVKKYTQKGYALKKYSTKDYIPVKNTKLPQINVKNSDCYHYEVNSYAGAYMPHLFLPRSVSTYQMQLMTMFNLPKYWDSRRYDLGNPQSMSITPDGGTAYVTHVFGSKGRIFKYDLTKMRRLLLDVPGRMQKLRFYGKGSSFGDLDPELEACVKVGPAFDMGHGSMFAYNPKDKHLWFVTKTTYSSKKKMDTMHLWRVNMNSLKPDVRIDFKMYNIKAVTWGNNITFDKNGKCYFFAYSGSKQGKCPKDAIKIYQGSINLKAKKKVTFKLMRNVICNPIVKNHGVQSAGYDYKNNRIYMVSNSALLSVPVSKLTKNKLKGSDVWMTQFVVNRELQGFEADKEGRWYLLANKDPEILTQMDLAKYDLAEDQFNSKGEYIGPEIDDGEDDEDDEDYDDEDDEYYEDDEE